MSLSLHPAASFSFLDPVTLRAFSPCPETGTIFGPQTVTDSSNPADVSRLITAGEPAEDLELFSLLLGTEAEQLARTGRQRGMRPPYPIPAQKGATSHENETPWFLEAEHVDARQGGLKQLVFSSLAPRRSVFMDFTDPSHSCYGFRLASEEADVSQTIAVDTRNYRVATEQFVFRIRAENFSNAVQMALAISSAVYFCGQYKVTELGGFGFRLMSESVSKPLTLERGKFCLPHPLPSEGVRVSFLSQFSLPEDAAGRQQPVANIDLHPADRKYWNVAFVLRRPAARGFALMSLHKKLMRTLWNPSFARIFSNRTGKI
jgi:hypothetical protein